MKNMFDDKENDVTKVEDGGHIVEICDKCHTAVINGECMCDFW